MVKSALLKTVSKKLTFHRLLLIIILMFSFVTKAWNIANPDTHYFDEIYYGFTAEQYAQGNIKAWVWDYTPPEGFAYTWDHPPTGKLIMSFFVKLFGVNSTSRRLGPLISGSLLPLIVYLLSKTIFPKKINLALIAAFLTACEGLVLSLSRIALTDCILTLFISLTALFLWQKKYLFSALFFGLAVSTKWTGIYLLPLIGITLISQQLWNHKIWLKSFKIIMSVGVFYIILGTLIYLISYAPLFIHYGGQKFIDLHKQMWWYHTNLEATHPSQSPAYLWPLNYRNVWFWVDYGKEKTANIYAMLNPAIAWGGIIAVLITMYYFIEKKSKKLGLLLLAYFIFWVPWCFSPRIMFLYHYLPSVPFLVIIISYTLDKMLNSNNSVLKNIVVIYLSLVLSLFIFFFPYWTGIPVVNEMVDKFRWLKTWGP